MKYELKEKLINANIELFPTEYQHKSIVVSDGWYDLIENLLNELKNYPVILKGITERYGRLEVSYDITRNIDMVIANNINTIIELAAKKSTVVCSVCGDVAESKITDSAFQILCKKHLIQKVA